MVRPRSEDKRNAIMAAATRVIVSQGLSAPTATIAQEAGVANGSLFTYFETKAELFNALYLELKAEMAAAAMAGLPRGGRLREQMLRMWSNWMAWAMSNPDQRRALAQLGVSGEITDATRALGHSTMAGIGALLEQCRAKGPMRTAPMPFVGALLNALAEATMDFMVQEPDKAEQHADVAFEALWRMLT